jgi:hypothetical protein
MPVPPIVIPSFYTAWLKTFEESGGSWVSFLGSSLIIYSFLALRTQKSYGWTIVVIHGIFTLFGQTVESIFLAKQISQPGFNGSLLLGFNEINHIIAEACIVIYSTNKLQQTIPSKKTKKVIFLVLGVLLVLFAIARGLVGVTRARQNLLWSDEVSFQSF